VGQHCLGRAGMRQRLGAIPSAVGISVGAPQPYAHPNIAGGGCMDGGDGYGSRHPVEGSHAGGGPKWQRDEEAELGLGGPTPKRPRMVLFHVW
jgi:hypothetical protein